MRTWFYLLCLLLPCFAFGQRIAVLEFSPGVGVSAADVDGLSSIFVTYFAPEGYTLVERSQIDRVIDEQNFQRSKMTEAQMVRVGEILNLSKIVVGNINIIMGEYNVDVRVVNVKSGTIAATEGASFVGGAYRGGMKQLALNLAAKISNSPVPQRRPKDNGQIYSDEVINSLQTEAKPLTYVVAYNGRIYFVNKETLEQIRREEKAYGTLPDTNGSSRKVIYETNLVVVEGGEDAFAVYAFNDFIGRITSARAIDVNLFIEKERTLPNLLPSISQCRKMDSIINELNDAISHIGGEPLKSQYWTCEYKFYAPNIWGNEKFRESYCTVAEFSWHDNGGTFISDKNVMNDNYTAFCRPVYPKHKFSVFIPEQYID
ncbi:MAG: CsgG/HfaB family protein [Muribaculaceae bacterium]|nr:CsgG/HfaB family protein [Muribaculaceae bacterium]